MIKLIDILEEGAILLTPDERDQIEKMIPKIIDVISGPYISDNDSKYIGDIKYEFADKTPGKVSIYVKNDELRSNGYFQTNDPKNPTDNIIVVQQNNFMNYFTNLGGLVNKTQKFIAGDENTGVELLRQTLKHELIHAKDPAENHHQLKEPYDSSKAEVYYKSWAEFQTMTGQFFESIIAEVDRILASNPSEKNIKKIEAALSNILNYFAGKTKELKQDTIDFIQNTQSRNLFQRLIKGLEVATGLDPVRTGALGIYLAYIAAIKRYHPDAFNEFLKDLYKTIDQIKDKIKNIQNSNTKLKEMQYINEAKRFQRLAGIIAEEETQTDPIADKDAEQGLKQALSTLKSGISNLQPSPKDGELDESLVAGLIAGAPGLINLLGTAVNKVSSLFQKDKKKGTVVGNALKHWGHELEDAYIGIIGDALLALFPSAYKGQNVRDKSSKLYDAAHMVYGAMLITLAVQGGVGLADAHNVASAATEGGLVAFKASEVADLAKKIAAVKPV